MEEFLTAFHRADFFSLEHECGRSQQDRGVADIYFTDGVRSLLIHDRLGCEGAPHALRVLEREIDRITGTAAWVGEDGDVLDPADFGATDHGPLVP
jgi:hypothetical protein